MKEIDPKINGAVSLAIGGRARQEDQADLLLEESGKQAFAIVCDGMGGHPCGELASFLSVDTFLEDYNQIKDKTENYSAFFRQEVKKLDEIVAGIEDTRGKRVGAGTTLAAVCLRGNQLEWISVGDSRIYIFRGRDIINLVREHNYRSVLNDHLISGKISLRDYRVEDAMKGDALISYIGMGNVKLMEISDHPMQLVEGDVILLASDGLTKALSETQIQDIIHSHAKEEIEDVLEMMQEYVSKACGEMQDNTSIVMMRYGK